MTRYCHSSGIVCVCICRRRAKTWTFCDISVITEDIYLELGLVVHYEKGNIPIGEVTLKIFLAQLCPFFDLEEPASVAQLDAPSDWRPGGRGFNPRRGRQHSFVEIDHEIFSTVILSLPLIQEGQLSVSGERMCTILVNRLED